MRLLRLVVGGRTASVVMDGEVIAELDGDLQPPLKQLEEVMQFPW